MPAPVALAWSSFLLAIAFVCSWLFLPLLGHILNAKSTGLRYTVVPYYQYNFVTARIVSRTLLRALNYLHPHTPVTSWRHLVTTLWPLKLRHAPFKAFGTDTFLVVAPGGIIFNTADASVIAQILSRGLHFPKATDIYKQIDIYGKNVVSSEGASWRYHRKLTSPAFSEKNNQLVWKETLHQSQAMIAKLLRPGSKSRTVKHLAHDTMRLSLEVLGRAGLGERLEWPAAISTSSDPPATSFTSSLEYISIHLVTIMVLLMIFPKWLLRIAPVSSFREALKAYEDWKHRMKEMIRVRRIAMRDETTDMTSTDLIGQLVKGNIGDSGEELARANALSDSEILGNMFVFMVAGHETSANTIHFTLVLLALHPHLQKEVQAEIDGILCGRSPEEWSFGQDLPQLLNGILGATLSESLRIISPVLTIPKAITQPRSLHIDGRDVIIPANTLFRLCIPAVHRNPKFWPHGPPTNPEHPIFPLDNLDNDLEEFKPDRWTSPGRSNKQAANHSDKNLNQHSLPFVPVEGAYIPFSDGPRSCLGRRFAQVEILAALAVVLSTCSVELAVDEWANDEQVSGMTLEDKKLVWDKAHDKAQATLRDKMTCIVTVQLASGASIPLRFVRKTEERFFF